MLPALQPVFTLTSLSPLPYSVNHHMNVTQILWAVPFTCFFEKYLFESISDYKQIDYMNTKFILFHYPILEWNHFFRGSIHLHGHQHNKPEYNLENLRKGIKRYDVGVDANNMTPISADEIIAFFKNI